MQDKSLAVQSHSSITPWASRQDVRELGKRIKELLPGGEKLKEHEALALAQAAVAHNLDPFNGELWFIPGRGLMAGIKGHRRSAHHQMDAEGGGNYWPEFEGPLSIDELNALKIPTDALAFRCRIYDSKNISTYTDSVSKLLSAGAPWDEVSKMFGNRPYSEGVGYWKPGEQTKMTPVQCAMKRAEADALKRRFDLPFTMAVGINGDADEVLAGEFEITPEQDPAEVQERMQAASQSLRGDQGSNIDLGPDWKQTTSHDNDKPIESKRAITWPADVIAWAVKELGVTSYQVIGALKQSKAITPVTPEDEIKHWLSVRKTERDAGVEGQEATGRADADYLATHAV